MKIRTLLALCSGVTLGTTAMAQPIPDADLGALISGTPSTGTVTGIAATSRTKWVKFTISGVVRANGDFLDIDTNGGTLTPGGDSMIGLYNSTGGFLAFNDESGAGAYSMLSFGSTTSRPGLAPTGNATAGNGAAHTGGNGATLATGTYWLAITGFGGTVFGTNNWGVTSTHARTGDVAYRLAYQYTALPSNPAGTGSFAPTSVTNCGDTTSQTLASVLVTPGTNPTSTGTVVTADLTSVGGSASQMLFDNATNGDVVAGDNRFSFLVTVPNTVTIGGKTFTFNIVDAQARTATGTSSSLSVTVCPPPAPAYDNCAGAVAVDLSGGPASIDGYVTPRSSTVTLPFCVTGLGNRAAFYTVTGNGGIFTVDTSATTGTGRMTDTVVAVYCATTGCSALRCIGGDDDNGTGNYSLFSFCTEPNARYVVVVTGYNGATGSFNVVMADTGVACSTAIPCALSGACCIAVESVCVTTTAAACGAQGGTYLGDNVACGSTSYGEPYASADTFPISIPDFANATPGSASTTATVAGNGGTVDALSISVGLTHTFPGDLIGTLSDGTTSALLFSRQGGSNDVAGVYSFSSDGTNIFAGGAPFNPYASFNSLSAFTGSAIDATWTLTVTDNASLDVGTINSFNISFGTTTPSCSFCPSCAADYDNSGGVDGADVDAFFVDWAAAAACADVDQSGGVDGADVDAFFVDWSAGGC